MPEHEAPNMSDHDLLMRVCDNQERIERKLDGMCRILQGNGKPTDGVLWRLSKLEEQAEQRARGAARRDKVLWTVVGALVTSAVGWAFAAIAPAPNPPPPPPTADVRREAAPAAQQEVSR